MSPNLGFLSRNYHDFIREDEQTRQLLNVWFALWRMEEEEGVMECGCFAGDTAGNLIKILSTPN